MLVVLVVAFCFYTTESERGPSALRFKSDKGTEHVGNFMLILVPREAVSFNERAGNKGLHMCGEVKPNLPTYR